MPKKDIINQIWVIANEKEAEFEYFCKVNDLNAEHPQTLKMFKNEYLETAEVANG